MVAPGTEFVYKRTNFAKSLEQATYVKIFSLLCIIFIALDGL